MAYTVNKTRASATPNSYTVQDNIVNTETDLSLIGKGYAGYGELIAENFLHLLENFSNNNAPSKPIQGQLWYDSDNNRLKVYTGSAFNPLGGAAYQADAPSGQTAGDIWIDSDTGQMYFYNGSANILVGPPSATGTNNGFIFDSIADSTDTTQNITKLFNDGNLIAIISEDTFTPKSAISGFATITKGITLSTAISDIKFAGTATDADKLGGIAAANFLRSNANDTTTGTIGIVNDSGMTVGADNDLSITVDGSGVNFTNTVVDTDLIFKVNDGGSSTTVMTIDGATARVGVGTSSPSSLMHVDGTLTATTFSGALTGAASLNLLKAGDTMTGTLNTQGVLPSADATYDLGSSSKKYNVVYAKATSAQYADLAEVYTSDAQYEPGTVVIFGGTKEVTQSQFANDTAVAGIVSTKPAYLMNEGSEGVEVALVGKVPCKVEGMCKKGDLLTTSGNTPGHAKKAIDPKLGSIIGKAMEDHSNAGQGVIYVSVGKH
jgi:hypothetical protein